MPSSERDAKQDEQDRIKVETADWILRNIRWYPDLFLFGIDPKAIYSIHDIQLRKQVSDVMQKRRLD